MTTRWRTDCQDLPVLFWGLQENVCGQVSLAHSHRARCARDQQRQQRQTPHQCRSSNKASNIKKQGILGQSQYVYFQSTLVFHAQRPTVFCKEGLLETWYDLCLSFFPSLSSFFLSFFHFPSLSFLLSFFLSFFPSALVLKPVQMPESHYMNPKVMSTSVWLRQGEGG